MLNLVSLILPAATELLKRLIPDPVKRDEAELEMRKVLNEAQIEMYKAQAVEDQAKKDIITTEMQQSSWFSDWRAKLMTMCTVMIGFNWIIVPLLNSLLHFFGTQVTATAIPTEAWLLLNVGLGGYIGEKTMATYQAGKVERAKAENPINEEVLAAELRRTLFKQGMTQSQWESIRDAADKANG